MTRAVHDDEVADALERAAGWLRSVQDRLDPADDLHAVLRRALTHCESVEAEPWERAAADAGDFDPGPPSSLLRAGRTRLLAASRAAQAQRPLPAHVHEELSGTLPAVMVAALRSYDLLLGSELLCAVAALLGRDAEIVGKATDFLLAQQQPDGSFGAFDPEIETLASMVEGSDTKREADMVLVPVAAACVGALRGVAARPSSTTRPPRTSAQPSAAGPGG